MRKCVVSAVVAVASLGLAVSSSSIPPVHAAAVACTNGGTALTNPYTVAIDGVLTAPTEPGRYGDYWVLVCRDTSNRDYNVFGGRYDANTSGGQGRFVTADLNKQFTISFLPEAGTTPLVAQGHGVMSAFTIDVNDSNRVTLTTKPISYSDIYGNDCGNAAPADCVLNVKTNHGDRASADNIEIRVSIRYGENGTAEDDFVTLQGMSWSSSAYYFWMRTSCPAKGATSNAAISFEVGGPHLKFDGTQNFGNITVFIPTSGVVGCFGAPPSIALSSLTFSRTENGTTVDATTGTATDVGLQYTVTADDATGLTIVVPQVTFSKPTYGVRTKTGKSLSRKTFTKANMLSLSRLKKPAGGTYKLVSKSTKTCAATSAKVFAYKKGTCKVAVVTYNKSGKKVASKTIALTVR